MDTLTDVPRTSEPGPFSFDEKRVGEKGERSSSLQATPLQKGLLCILKETQDLDKDIRHLKFGRTITIPDKHRAAGKTIGTHEIRKEITYWYDLCSRLEHELQTRKAQRHTPWEIQVEQLKAKEKEKDQQNLSLKARVHELEGDVTGVKQELLSIRREKTELQEKNQKMVNENLPVLDKIDKQLVKSREAVDQLTADAEMLSSMFKLQVEDNRKTLDERDEISKELNKVHRSLKSERLKNQFKEDEFKKKESLYERTVEARKATHESYLQQKTKIVEVEERMRTREQEWEEKLKEVEKKDAEIAALTEELWNEHQEIDELEQQKKLCMQEFKAATGRPYSMLLEQFKVAPPEELGL